MFDRVAKAQEFWNSWNDESWPQIQDALMRPIERALGSHSNYYAIDGGEWPPRALLRIRRDDGWALVTIGMSIRPQPRAEMYVDQPSSIRRIELAIAIDHRITEKAILKLCDYLSAQARLPWNAFTWLGEGHTVGAEEVFASSKSSTKFEAVALTRLPPGAPTIKLPKYRGDPVNLLWGIPITGAERELAEKNGSQELLRLLWNSGVEWIHRPRDELRL